MNILNQIIKLKERENIDSLYYENEKNIFNFSYLFIDKLLKYKNLIKKIHFFIFNKLIIFCFLFFLYKQQFKT